jgi:alpha-tubulin suppressor-like RCC1 family protein
VAGNLTFVSISTGASFACGLTVSGLAYCWGLNNYGQLGDGTTENRLTPVLVSGGLTFTELSAGIDQVCGVTKTAAYCWGQNDRGQLGDGPGGGISTVPVQVLTTIPQP